MTETESRFLAIAEGIRSAAKAMRRCSDVEILSFAVHPPATEARIDEAREETETVIPAELTDLMRSFNGAELLFRWDDRAKGCLREGAIRIPSLVESLELRTYGIDEAGLCWIVAPGTSQAHVILGNDSGTTFLVGREDNYARSNELSVEDALEAMVATLGLPNWEMTLYEHWFEDDDPDELDELEDAAKRLNLLLGLSR
jgi:hypothetical protein